MKIKMTFILFSLSLLLPVNAWADHGDYTIPALMEEANAQSYEVLIHKYQVYQAKAEVSVQMGKVIPHINFGALLSLGLQDFVSAAAGIVGFLFPSNWYDLEVARELYRAKQLKTEADIANILQSVEGLALQVHALEMLNRIYEHHKATVEKFVAKAEEANRLGELTDATYLKIMEFENAFERFHTVITSQLRAGYADLADLVGLPIEGDAWSHFRLAIMDLPDLGDKEERDPADCEQAVFLNSRILKSFDHIYEARQADIESRRWRWLHPDADSEDSLFLSTSARVNQGWALLREMWVQGEAAKSHLKNAIWQAVNQNNTAIQLYRSSRQELEIHQNLLSILNASFGNGPSPDGTGQSLEEYLEQYTQIFEDIMDAEVETIMAQHQYLAAWSKLRRLHWFRPYRRVNENMSYDQFLVVNLILEEQEEEGFEIEKFEIDGDSYEDGTIVLTERLLLPTESFPHISNGEWTTTVHGDVEMKFTYKGSDYHAVGTVEVTSYLFANTANFELDIFDSENIKVGVIELTD